MSDGIRADVYVLTDKRTKDFIFEFLDTFLPDREEAADEYEIPRFSQNPTKIFYTAEQIIRYCCKQHDVEQAIYWSNKSKKEPRNAMIFFTEDGYLILGLSTGDASLEDYYLNSLMDLSDSQVGYIDYASPPEMSAKTFQQKAQVANNQQNRKWSH